MAATARVEGGKNVISSVFRFQAGVIDIDQARDSLLLQPLPGMTFMDAYGCGQLRDSERTLTEKTVKT